MAEKNDRLSQNVSGRYYVDATCIDCDQCRATAPEFFRRDDETGYAVVHHQPVTVEEVKKAEEARLGCPSESIGNDGEHLPF